MRKPRAVYVGHHSIRREERRKVKRAEERAQAEPTDGDVRRIIAAARKRELKAARLKAGL